MDPKEKRIHYTENIAMLISRKDSDTAVIWEGTRDRDKLGEKERAKFQLALWPFFFISSFTLLKWYVNETLETTAQRDVSIILKGAAHLTLQTEFGSIIHPARHTKSHEGTDKYSWPYSHQTLPYGQDRQVLHKCGITVSYRWLLLLNMQF